MEKLLAMILMSLFIVGCSSAPVTAKATNKVNTNDTPSANPANLSTVTPVPTSPVVATQATTVSARPAIVTVKPPLLPVAPVQGTPPVGSVPTPIPKSLAGWQTFDSPSLGIAIDYPSDWSVMQQPDGAAFASPQGAKILLQAIKTNGTSGGNQQCATLITSYGLTANTCVDATSHIYSATFNLKLADGATKLLMLSTINQAALDVYKQMLDSLRLR